MLVIITDVVDSDVWCLVLHVFEMHALNLFFLTSPYFKMRVI